MAAALGAAAWYIIWRRKRNTTTWTASAEWAAKRSHFEKLTADHLLVITDFDATLTTGDSEQCHDVMGNSPLLSTEFRKEFAPLLDWCARPPFPGNLLPLTCLAPRVWLVSRVYVSGRPTPPSTASSGGTPLTAL